MKKKALIFLLLAMNYVLCFGEAAIGDDTIRNNIVPVTDSSVLSVGNGDGLGMLDTFLAFVRDSIFNLLALITVGLFLFIGAKLLIARGNPEEFKKALFAFIYAIIGLIIIGLSWAAVKLIVGLKF